MPTFAQRVLTAVNLCTKLPKATKNDYCFRHAYLTACLSVRMEKRGSHLVSIFHLWPEMVPLFRIDQEKQDSWLSA